MAIEARAAFHDALRRAIDARGLSLERISAHLQARGHMVSIATLSYWQSGRSAPSRPASLRALGSLEAILGVERGSLAALVPQPDAPPNPTGPSAMADITRQAQHLDRLAAEQGLSWETGLTSLSCHARYFADDRGFATHLHTREVLQVSDPAALYVVGAYHPLSGVDIHITGLLGGTVERTAADRADSVSIAGLRLPPVRPGDCHVLEFEIAYLDLDSDRLPLGMATGGMASHLREMYVEVNFTPGAAPSHVRVVEGRGDESTTTVVPVTHPTISLLRAPFGPGHLGFEWDLPLDPGDGEALPPDPARTASGAGV